MLRSIELLRLKADIHIRIKNIYKAQLADTYIADYVT